ncbi:MAG: glutamine-hydrolyzing carbamoyl-phosphate synthase small subunit [Bacteroidota bacterium]
MEDGSLFSGKAFGKHGTAGGEICFNTGMSGYQEIYSDPSYFGQIIINTTAHIGNYGTISAEQESAGVKVSGVVCGSFATLYSRLQSDLSLQQYLANNGIPGISDIDTRKLVRHIRKAGAMRAVISTESGDKVFLERALQDVPLMLNLELSSVVSTKDIYHVGNPDAKLKVAVLDLGIKNSILNNLAKRDAYCTVFPAKTSFAEMQKSSPDGYFISNGPGDPAGMNYAIETVSKVLEAQKPLFGICLGHQLLAQACGIDTYKMHHGHRGLNHPVKNLVTGRTEITSQNHGFNVQDSQLVDHKEVEITHINLNDNTVEGLRLKNGRAFSVQYHPESSPGPHDSTYLFDDFLQMAEKQVV